MKKAAIPVLVLSILALAPASAIGRWRNHPSTLLSNLSMPSRAQQGTGTPSIDKESLGDWVQFPLPPASYPLLAADFVADDDGWAVGLLPDVLHWNGSSWEARPIPKGTMGTLRGLTLLSSNEGWAVGNKGTILHWDGHNWTIEDSPTDLDLLGVAFLSSQLGFAVGGSPGDPIRNVAPNTVIIQWDGAQWRKIPSPAGYPLESIAIVSENDAWAVGYDTILHWNGERWEKSPLQQPDGIFFHSIAARDVDDAWIAGEKVNAARPNAGVILHWNGTQWIETQIARLGLFSVAMISKSAGWAVGGGGVATANGGSIILRWDGQTWSEYPSPTTLSIQFIWADDVDEGWIVAGGKSGDADFQSAIYRYIIRPTTIPALAPTTTAVPISTPVPTDSPVPPRPTTTNRAPTYANPPEGGSADRLTILIWPAAVIALAALAGGALFIFRRRHK